MKYYLGIDSGGTKTAFLLTDSSGKVIDSITDSTSNYLQIGIDGMANILKKNVCLLMKKYSINNEDLCIFIGLASYGEVKESIKPINDAIDKSLLNIKHCIGNDNDNSFAGSLECKTGINIVSGTGSIAFGKDDKGNEQRSGGWGYFYNGDEGSGHWIGSMLIKEFEKQADNRHPKTKLYSKVKEELNITDDFGILNILINEWKFDRTKVASLAKIVFELASENDDAALKIIDEAAFELAEIVNALVKSLEFNDQINVSYSGGIFKNGGIILEPFKKYLDKRCIIKKPSLSPVCGSILLAMKYDGIDITNEIIANLKD